MSNVKNTKIKIKRGNRSTVQNVKGEYGELILCQDSKELFFFDADSSLQRMRDVIVSNTEPIKVDNLLWLDITTNKLKRWSQSLSIWIDVTNTVDLSNYYTKESIDMALDGKMNKVQLFATDNLLKVNASGHAVDSGKKVSDFALNEDVGDKNNLNTNNKSTMVDGINELKSNIDKFEQDLLNINQKTSKTIIFIFNGVIKNGVQPIEIKFPYEGQIQHVYASCVNPPTSSDLVIQIEKISEAGYENNGIWDNIFLTNLTIDKDKKSNISSQTPYEFKDINVNKNDVFRVNIINSGEAQNLTVEIKIAI